MESLSTQLAALNKEHLALEEKLGAAELAMLNSKDERVASLQDKCDELAAQCREAESRCHAAEGSLRTAEQAAASTEARLQVTNHDSRERPSLMLSVHRDEITSLASEHSDLVCSRYRAELLAACRQTELDRNAQLLTMAQNDVAELRMQHSEMVTSALPTRASAA